MAVGNERGPRLGLHKVFEAHCLDIPAQHLGVLAAHTRRVGVRVAVHALHANVPIRQLLCSGERQLDLTEQARLKDWCEVLWLTYPSIEVPSSVPYRDHTDGNRECGLPILNGGVARDVHLDFVASGLSIFDLIDDLSEIE